MNRFLPLILALPLCIGCGTGRLEQEMTILRGEESRAPEGIADIAREGTPEMKARALLSMGRVGRPRDVPDMIAGLRDASPDVRGTAAFALGEAQDKDTVAAYGGTQDPTVLPALLHAFQDADPVVSGLAAEAIGKIGDSRGTAPLTTALESQSGTLTPDNLQRVELITIALMRLKAVGAVPAISAAAKSPMARLRMVAAIALRRIGDPAGREATLRLLDDADPDVRAAAVKAMGKIGLPADAPAILQKVSDADFHARIEAIRSLGEIKDADIFNRELPPVLQDILLKGLEATGSTTGEAGRQTNLLITLLDVIGEQGTHRPLLATLRQIRERPDVVGGHAQVAYARVAARTGRPESFFPYKYTGATGLRFAAQALGELKSPSAAREVQRLLSLPVTPELRAARPALLDALNLTMRPYDPKGTDKLLIKELRSTDPIVRAHAVSALVPEDEKEPPSPELIPALLEALRNERGGVPDARITLVDALARVKGDPNVNNALVEKIDDPNPTIRAMLMKALRRGSPADFDACLAGRISLCNVIAHPATEPEEFAQLLADLPRQQPHAVITTRDHGELIMDLYPSDAPLAVQNFIHLARRGYFNGQTFHRVVPDFVAQTGDPRNDMEGGPGYSIPCEINMHRFERGTVGMALSGKDTGGSQYFIALSPQPHLDGGYTVFGHIRDTTVLDDIVQYDVIEEITIRRVAPPASDD